ncbi:PDR/VanB family oxidoreductase [Paraburkholderia lycopersici]|uniref:Vanillate O-demethylase ferredoxin subunit n=1 Tax=Paraburkholderia lycopersici TaxID=416944 RepID=A0A1G6H8Y8_9BURK|nr:PDR/VanB family oxidoreductase [Paraburkholderia lycopersici]SDB90722.1 vanillate O-demethylase ferredoxin subunit [Paraburkholderia lycopersici]
MLAPMFAHSLLTLRVAAVDAPTSLIKSITLEAADGALLPGFEPGAHLQVEIPPATAGGAAQWRSYSLIHLDPAVDPRSGVRAYRLGVRREDEGRGGSRHMHALEVGATLNVRAPVNHFALAAPPRVLLIAGGIGITPIVSMATALAAQQRDFELHFSGRTREALPFVDELRALAGANLVLHADDDAATRLSIDALLDGAQVNQPIYVCGPAGMIEAVLAAARERGWHECDLHYELFTEAAPQEGDTAFEVELKSSGKRLTVPADKSLLDTLVENGVDVMYDCRSGYCGLCTTGVCDGDIEHRDTYLSDADKAGGKVMQVCVSRCRRGRLVLDL